MYLFISLTVTWSNVVSCDLYGEILWCHVTPWERLCDVMWPYGERLCDVMWPHGRDYVMSCDPMGKIMWCHVTPWERLCDVMWPHGEWLCDVMWPHGKDYVMSCGSMGGLISLVPSCPCPSVENVWWLDLNFLSWRYVRRCIIIVSKMQLSDLFSRSINH